MNGGRGLRDKLTFESRTLTTAASGQVSEAWAAQFTRWGSVVQVGASERVVDDQQRNFESYRITLPADSQVGAVTAAGWRVSWRNQLNQTRVLNLVGIDTSGGGRSLELVLSAVLQR